MKIVEITWKDACGADGWVSHKEVLDVCMADIITIGYVINETKDFLTLTMAYDSSNKNYGAYLLIPKVNIVKKRILNK